MSKASRAINGFAAWAREFVHQAIDHNGTMMTTELDEQIAMLSEAATVSFPIDIPDIRTDDQAREVVDEIIYRLWPMASREPQSYAASFRKLLVEWQKNVKDLEFPQTLEGRVEKLKALGVDPAFARESTEYATACVGLPRQPFDAQVLISRAAEAEERIPYDELEAETRRCSTCGNLWGFCSKCSPRAFYPGELEEFYRTVRDACGFSGNDCGMVTQDVLKHLDQMKCIRCDGGVVISPKNVVSWKSRPNAEGDGVHVEINLLVNPAVFTMRLRPVLEENRKVTELDFHEQEIGVHFHHPAGGDPMLVLDSPRNPSNYVLVIRKYAEGKRPLPKK